MIPKSKWIQIIIEHLKKMNYIVNDNYTIPTSIIPQIEIFVKQLEKHINIDETVAVLSAFPIFIFDYYGFEKFRTFSNEIED